MLRKTLYALLLLFSSVPAMAADVVTVRFMSLEIATDIATAAVEACRKAGYQVSVVVVDRSANVMVTLRDVHASRFTTEIARRKANAVVLSGVSTAEFARNRADILREMNEVDGILVLAGGLPVSAAGSLLGAVGVSGAPGSDKDEACAAAGIEAVAERLEFAD